MDQYEGNNSKKIVAKWCPSCEMQRTMQARNTYCSPECARTGRKKKEAEDYTPYAYEPPKNVTLPKPEAKEPSDDKMQRIIAMVTTEVTNKLMPLFQPAKPSIHAYEPESVNFTDGITMVLSDIHFQTHHILACSAVNQFMDEYSGKLQRLMLAGDVFDAAALSRHMPRKRQKNMGDLGREMEVGAPIINSWAAHFPEAYMLGGNHEQGRIERMLANEGKGIPAKPLEFENLLSFYGINVDFINERRFDFGYGDGQIRLFHGEKYNKHTAASILADNHYVNSGQGHTHRPQVYYEKGKVGFVNGHLMDVNQQDYMPDPNWTMGFTLIEHFNQGHDCNVFFIKINEQGEFSYNGKVYRGHPLEFA